MFTRMAEAGKPDSPKNSPPASLDAGVDVVEETCSSWCEGQLKVDSSEDGGSVTISSVVRAPAVFKIVVTRGSNGALNLCVSSSPF